MSAIRVLGFAMALASICGGGVFAKGGGSASLEKPLPVASLEGNWKVASTTWEGAQNGYPPDNQYSPFDFYPGMVLSIEIASKGGAAAIDNSTETQFIVSLGPPYDKTTEGMTFCAERHPYSPNSYNLYRGYPKPRLWRLDDYPCEIDEARNFSIKDYPALRLTQERYLVRIDVKDASRAHAVVVFSETLFYAVNEADREKEFGGLKLKCDKEMCYLSANGDYSVFELELTKLK